MRSRNQHPQDCRATEDIFKTGAAKNNPNYDAVASGAVLEGHAVMRSTPKETFQRLLRLLPKLLAEDPEDMAAAGWCPATPTLLEFMLAEKALHVQVFRKALLNNGDAMSSSLDLSQPATDNTWGLVPYYDDQDGTYYLCVLQVLYYLKIRAGTDISDGFDPDTCALHEVEVPVDTDDECIPHEPLRVAVGKLWLAAGATEAMGALGCRSSYDPRAGVPPDLVVVKTLSEGGPLIEGTKREVLGRGSTGRYYGISYVHVNNICCQLGPTRYSASDGCHCFLTCSKRSGKK